MLWLFWLAVALAVLVIAAVGVGAALPVKHVSTRRVHLRQGPEAAWTVIRDVAGYASWRPGLKSVEVLGEQGGKQRYREKGDWGDVLFEVEESVPPRRLAVRVVDAGGSFGGRWVFELAPEGSGCSVAVTEEGEVYRPLFRFLSRFVIGHHRSQVEWLRALGRKLGEEVVPE